MGLELGSQPTQPPHAVVLPYPAQGHVTPMLKLAKLLHHVHGFRITFVNTHYNHARLLRSASIPADFQSHGGSFRFDSISDGLPGSEAGGDATQDIPTLCASLPKNSPEPFRQLMRRLMNDDPEAPPTCVLADAVMTFAVDVATELGLPVALVCTPSASGFMGYLHYQEMVDRGITPFKDKSYVTDSAYLDTPLDWFPGARPGLLRIRDVPSFIRTSDVEDIMLNFFIQETRRARLVQAFVVNTFDELEGSMLHAMSKLVAPIYTVGPLHVLLGNLVPAGLTTMAVKSTLWKEDSECLMWLDGREPESVVLVNFGSIAVMTKEHLQEFAWGLADSGKYFLWIVRPDLVSGDTAVLSPAFLEAVEGRSMLAGWCNQEKILQHPSIGGFLTHSGWNSTLESLCSGVPMISWPFFAEQPTNCRYACEEWGVAMEIDTDVKRREVEVLVRELMGEGEKGKEMKRRAAEWKEKAAKAAALDGPAAADLERLVKEVLLRQVK